MKTCQVSIIAFKFITFLLIQIFISSTNIFLVVTSHKHILIFADKSSTLCRLIGILNHQVNSHDGQMSIVLELIADKATV